MLAVRLRQVALRLALSILSPRVAGLILAGPIVGWGSLLAVIGHLSAFCVWVCKWVDEWVSK